jgi:excisionase family DNA binding protein
MKELVKAEYWTAEEVASYLDVKKSTIRKWCHFGFIPHYKIGSAVRFHKTKIDKWLEDCENVGRPTRLPVKGYRKTA